MSRRLWIRGQPQTLRLYGPRNGDPVIVSSGDGGWIHLAPHVAEVLSRSGFFVVGFDTRAYLASFTSSRTSVKSQQEPVDYRALIEFASSPTGRRPTLIGVSEGAGLSVLAATDPGTKTVIAGVIGLGLPDLNELGWRWRDSMIYLTHGVPNEPTFSAAAIVKNVAAAPRSHSLHRGGIRATLRGATHHQRRRRAEEALDGQGIRPSLQRQPAGVRQVPDGSDGVGEAEDHTVTGGRGPELPPFLHPDLREHGAIIRSLQQPTRLGPGVWQCRGNPWRSDLLLT